MLSYCGGMNVPVSVVCLQPGATDTFGDIQKEIKTLKLLHNIGAKNINLVIDAFIVCQSVWIVTDYCAGGSVATLMKPSGRLLEKWIIPILREVAEAISWIHRHGISHRDIKCANILVTQEGEVQLCDFGVAAMIQTRFDKRSIVIGTLHWMAPELFDRLVSYGPAVDIWAFGSVAYEMASGLPPNAIESHKAKIDITQFGRFLRGHIPRLDKPEFSDDLKDLVAYCLEESTDRRPSIEQVMGHKYIRDTTSKYPVKSLPELVRTFKTWEQHGGVRASLFNPMIGARPPTNRTSIVESDAWNFSTTSGFDEEVGHSSQAESLHDLEDNAQPKPNGRRRPPLRALAPLKAPLEKIFDPDTMSNYSENSQSYYVPYLPSGTDLPLRDDSRQAALRESLIDLDESFGGVASPVSDMDTIRPSRAQDPIDAASTAAADSRGGLFDDRIAPIIDQLGWQWPREIPPPTK
ncbi:hypothetical protein PG995_005323 [Apiospora arundinis]